MMRVMKEERVSRKASCILQTEFLCVAKVCYWVAEKGDKGCAGTDAGT